MLGKAKKKLAVLEIDERSANKIYPYITPTYLVCTNLFRDSLMRNAHTEFICDILNKYIPKETIMIENADDLICSHVAEQNKKYILVLLSCQQIQIILKILQEI